MNEYKWYDGEMVCSQYGYVNNDTKNSKKHKLPPWLISLLITLPTCILTVVFCCIAIAVNNKTVDLQNYSSSGNGQLPGNGAGNITINPPVVDNDKAVTALNSVVNIQNSGEYGGFFGQSMSLGEGSGVIVREDGYILTSASVVENVGTLTVKLRDKTKYNAKVYSIDSANNAAILKIDAKGLTPIVLGDSATVKLGDAVSVVGNSIHENLINPVLGGTVCGIDTNVSLQNGQKVNIFQIDASTIADSVGGLVLNANGELIGIATAMISNPSAEIGIATPINDLKNFLSNIISNEGWNDSGIIIGISGTDADYGVVIDKIGENTPAEKAGLKIGDLIVKADGEAVNSINEITNIKNRHKKGDTMVFTVYRDGEMTDINVLLE